MSLSESRVHATLPASDFARAKEFYKDKLGLTPVRDTPGAAFYEFSDGSRFVLFPSGGAASGTHTQMGFTVTDLKTEVAALQAAGVEFEEYDTPTFKTVNGVAENEFVKSSFFWDSERNLIGMVEFK